MRVEARLAELGLALPQPIRHPPNVPVRFAWVRLHGGIAYVSGHGALNEDGSFAIPLGKVGEAVDAEQAYQSARGAGLAILASLKREIGDLDRVAAWLSIRGYVNVAPGFTQTTAVLNGFSDLILDLYGPDAGMHARAAIGVAATPFDIPVIAEAQVAIQD